MIDRNTHLCGKEGFVKTRKGSRKGKVVCECSSYEEALQKLKDDGTRFAVVPGEKRDFAVHVYCREGDGDILQKEFSWKYFSLRESDSFCMLRSNCSVATTKSKVRKVAAQQKLKREEK